MSPAARGGWKRHSWAPKKYGRFAKKLRDLSDLLTRLKSSPELAGHKLEVKPNRSKSGRLDIIITTPEEGIYQFQLLLTEI